MSRILMSLLHVFQQQGCSQPGIGKELAFNQSAIKIQGVTNVLREGVVFS